VGIFTRLRRGITLLRTLDRCATALERLANRYAAESVEIVFEPMSCGTDDEALWVREAERAEYEQRTGRRLADDEEVPERESSLGRGH
jgi:hypothetical protein